MKSKIERRTNLFNVLMWRKHGMYLGGVVRMPFQLRKMETHQVKTALLFLHINVTKCPQGNLFSEKNWIKRPKRCLYKMQVSLGGLFSREHAIQHPLE